MITEKLLKDWTAYELASECYTGPQSCAYGIACNYEGEGCQPGDSRYILGNQPQERSDHVCSVHGCETSSYPQCLLHSRILTDVSDKILSKGLST